MSSMGTDGHAGDVQLGETDAVRPADPGSADGDSSGGEKAERFPFAQMG